ncbi:MAG: flagellar basal-body rod protein FlgF [Minwuia sp.]|nr:flagellar basal-body rod protein FlgF [Minwuia sp.]
MGIENAILVGLSRQVALRRQMDIVANNIANMNTVGFRAEQVMFREFLVDTKEGDKISYVQDFGVAMDVADGPLQSTSNPLDVAISGPGYLTVQTADGEKYTRNGHLRLDDQGRLVTQDGNPVLDVEGKEIEFADPTVRLDISRDGTITAADGETFRLQVVGFDNQQDLDKAEGGLYETDQAPFEIEDPQVLQGMLESSNVNAITEMTRMITVQRSYEAMQQMVKSDHDIQRDAIGRLGQVV